MFRLRYIAFALVTAASALPAQTASNDSTLAGIRRVVLIISTPSDQLAVFRDDTALELRKVGIRVLGPEAARADSIDAVVHIEVAPRVGRGCETFVRIAVEQRVRLLRTGTFIRVPTWAYEENANGACGDRWSGPTLKRGVDSLLTKWLDMNGR